ncbi:MAG: hypothetical protein M3422_04195 [Actinomycetota bacterium]|nr:hypothetical protein [Actinomycetota bacterium]
MFDRLVRRVLVDDQLDHDLAGRVVDQALAFLAASARNSSAPLAPSTLVDLGWHAFLLHTREYAAFCHSLAGRFLHHVPTEGASSADAHETLRRTVAAIESAGFTVDVALWTHAGAGGCTGCHNGCHDDPPPHR